MSLKTSSTGRVRDAPSSGLCLVLGAVNRVVRVSSKPRKAARLGEQCFAKLQRTSGVIAEMYLHDKVRSRF